VKPSSVASVDAVTVRGDDDRSGVVARAAKPSRIYWTKPAKAMRYGGAEDTPKSQKSTSSSSG
jgi:hypothetical protein